MIVIIHLNSLNVLEDAMLMLSETWFDVDMFSMKHRCIIFLIWFLIFNIVYRSRKTIVDIAKSEKEMVLFFLPIRHSWMCLLYTALRPVSDVKINYDLNWKFEETNCKLLINYKNALIFLSKLLYMTVLIIFDSKGESKWMLWQPSMQGRTFEYI